METIAEWLEKHPSVKARMFERNYQKQSGSGHFEAVCGFCLASRYFANRCPRKCRFCGALFRNAKVISTLPEVLKWHWRLIPAVRN